MFLLQILGLNITLSICSGRTTDYLYTKVRRVLTCTKHHAKDAEPTLRSSLTPLMICKHLSSRGMSYTSPASNSYEK